MAAYLPIMLAIFPGLACPISLVIVDDPAWRAGIASLAGAMFVSLLALVVYLGKRKKNREATKPAQNAFLGLAIVFAGFAILAAASALLAALSKYFVGAVSFALGAVGFFSYASLCFRHLQKQSQANKAPEPTPADVTPAAGAPVTPPSGAGDR